MNEHVQASHIAMLGTSRFDVANGAVITKGETERGIASSLSGILVHVKNTFCFRVAVFTSYSYSASRASLLNLSLVHRGEDPG